MGRLDAFLQATRERIAAGHYAPSGPRLACNGRLTDALAHHATPVIAELKPRSPSEGRLLRTDADAQLRAYAQGHAAALSILTDSTHFDGSPALLRQAHATGLPSLMKDFVLDDAQLACAQHNGASAVLLIERCFADPLEREALVAAAHARGLEVLLELHDGADLQRARTSRADLLGINARDLDTLHVDPQAALALVRAARGLGKPVVALSGIASRAEYRAARQAGAQAVLVGSHLMRSRDPALALLALQRPLAKVCGLRTTDDVQAAARAGADLVGLVVGSPDSPRNLPPLAAQRLATTAHDANLRTVLVTRATDPTLVLEWCRLVRPDYVQVHGFQPTADLRHRLANVPTQVLAVLAPDGPAHATADGIVLDTTPAGGSGLPHVWQPAPPGLSLVAGGLDAGNVRHALDATQAWGADASSRLETAPGRKDPQRILAFVQAVHAA